MFDEEEKIIADAEETKRCDWYRNNPLYPEFCRLLRNYKKLFRQFRMVLKMSDRQQIELKDSREAILNYNRELTREIKERKKIEKSLQKANMELDRLASLDGLTKIANRRRFDEYLEKQWEQTIVAGSFLALIIADIDFFKSFNDKFGHLEGDNCLRKVALAMSTAIERPSDLVARIGGEEFAVLLPETSAAEALPVAAAISRELERIQFDAKDPENSGQITLSMGIADIIPVPGQSPHQLIARADRALYKAKENGRNRIEIEPAARPASVTLLPY
jgi:diguanylate cyclase (GGDEF)-like protein